MGERAAFFARPSLGTVSRRAILQGGAAVVAMGFKPSSSMSAAMPTDQKLELYAFKAPASEDSVFAVILPDRWAKPMQRAGMVVHIHAGRENWVLPISSVGELEIYGAKAFVGPIRFSQNPAPMQIAVVLEAPISFLRAGESVDVWAEVRGENGSRWRVGSPLVAEIVACDPSLSEVYHKISPDLDKAELGDMLAASLAAKSRGAADPEMRGRRLASIFLPDVIRYRPGAPIGFNFADRNGRHPSDPTQALVDTIIAGMVVPGRKFEAQKLGNQFPYFPTPGAIS